MFIASALIGGCSVGLIEWGKKRKIAPIQGLTLPDYEIGQIDAAHPPAKYADLPFSKQDADWIYEVMNNGISNMLLRINLKKEGIQIHPFKFLAAIFTNDDLKARMREIFSSEFSFKQWAIFKQLDSGLWATTLEPYMEDFAQEVHLPLDALRSLNQENHWKELISLLLTNPDP